MAANTPREAITTWDGLDPVTLNSAEGVKRAKYCIVRGSLATEAQRSGIGPANHSSPNTRAEVRRPFTLLKVYSKVPPLTIASDLFSTRLSGLTPESLLKSLLNSLACPPLFLKLAGVF